MTPADDLVEFEQRSGVRIYASPPGTVSSDHWVVMLQTASTPNALAVVCDLSDSARWTARTAARLPGLLRGWDGSTGIWVYALGDTHPLRGIAAGTVGDLLDQAFNIHSTLEDESLTNEYSRRGSFIAPTLAALERRAASEGVGNLRVIVLTDGRLSDFSPALHFTAKAIGLMEPDEDVALARAQWSAVLNRTPLLFVGDREVEQFTAGGARSSIKLAVRLHDQDAQYHIPPGGGTVSDAWFEWLPSQGPLLVRVAPSAWGAFNFEGRLDDKVWKIEPRHLSSVATIPETEWPELRARWAEAVPSQVTVLFDSLASPDELDAAWQFAVEAFAAAASKTAWPPLGSMGFSSQAKAAVAAVCLSNRRPIGKPSTGDRLVVLGIMARSRGLRFEAGGQTPIGRLATAITIRHDRFENRWQVSVGQTAHARSHFVELCPTGSDNLPLLQTDDGTSWSAVFSGPLGSGA